jgi:putative Holliday junction resolvase
MTEYPILSIDYGEKHFGLAVSDSKGLLATPLDTLLKGRNTTTLDIINTIKEICTEYRIKTILLGYPQAFVKKHEETQNKINNFKAKLFSNTDIPIIMYDESFSTTTAQNMLTSTGQNSKKSRGKIDKIAATVFLQEFLNSKQDNNV